tara:strand:- start:31 stop:696 length:666 start_codon:yes stop_codon:yes gene_type:complete
LAKNKLRKFSEIEELPNVIDPKYGQLKEDISLKGKWNTEFFKNENPIVLELGCGKGEYSVALSQRHPKKNFIGVDIKGSRIWKGATDSNNINLKNIAFLRIRIEHILRCFSKDEISEIWITFPDPQIKKKRARKRLTHPEFLKKYSQILKDDGVIHLKTDSLFLYGYTLGIIQAENHELLDCTHDIYGVNQERNDVDIQTHYEKTFRNKGKSITYTRFGLN